MSLEKKTEKEFGETFSLELASLLNEGLKKNGLLKPSNGDGRNGIEGDYLSNQQGNYATNENDKTNPEKFKPDNLSKGYEGDVLF